MEINLAKLSVAAQLAKIRKERDALAIREKALMSKNNGKALAQIVKIAKDAGISIDDIAKALNAKPKSKATQPTAKKGKLAGVKVAAKYQNPANPDQTWTGRGVAPRWVQDLKTSNLLDTALILPSTQAG